MSLWLSLLQVIALTCINAQYFTCSDWMANHKKYSLTDGVYNITTTMQRMDYMGNSRPVYCSFDYSRNYAWTLFESGSRSSYSNSLDLLKTAFISNSPYYEDDVDTFRHLLYRLSREWIYSLYFLSDYLFATCEFDTSFSQDWLLFNLNTLTTEKDPFYDDLSATCLTVMSANIRGYSCSDATIAFWQVPDTWHMHTSSGDSKARDCDCYEWVNTSVNSEDNFGYYDNINTEFSCTKTSLSTTNWWFGSYVNEYINNTNETVTNDWMQDCEESIYSNFKSDSNAREMVQCVEQCAVEINTTTSGSSYNYIGPLTTGHDDRYNCACNNTSSSKGNSSGDTNSNESNDDSNGGNGNANENENDSSTTNNSDASDGLLVVICILAAIITLILISACICWLLFLSGRLHINTERVMKRIVNN